MYQWTHKEPLAAIQSPLGKLETSMSWPHANDKKTREGESKIPKLMTSTPKARIQLVSSLISMHDQPSLTLLNGTESDHNKVNELKMKMSKCETIPEMFLLIKSFINEYSMHSSESSTNSGIFSNSVLNGTDSVIFDRSMETTVFNVLNQRQRETPNQTKTPSPIKTKTPVKSRTSPNTPTGSTTRPDPKRFRRNLSVGSVNVVATSPQKPSEISSGSGCRRCAQLLTSPKKTTEKKRMVDKATVMEVEPIVFPKALELISIETQTDSVPEESVEPKKVEVSAPVPPPPPLPPSMMPPLPPPLPIPNAPSMPGGIIFTWRKFYFINIYVILGPPPPPPPGIVPASTTLSSSAPPMPFPPPIALNPGPGKLNSQTSSNSSSSSAANGKPKPLPLIPASEFYLMNSESSYSQLVSYQLNLLLLFLCFCLFSIFSLRTRAHDDFLSS